MKAFGRYSFTVLVVFAAAFYFSAAHLGVANGGQESKTSGAPAGNAENGKRLFAKDGCYECHGREGQGSIMSGPRIAPDPPPFEVVSTYIRKPKGEMPPYTTKVLPDKDLADIYAFLQSRPKPPAKAAEMVK